MDSTSLQNIMSPQDGVNTQGLHFTYTLSWTPCVMEYDS